MFTDPNLVFWILTFSGLHRQQEMANSELPSHRTSRGIAYFVAKTVSSSGDQKRWDFSVTAVNSVVVAPQSRMTTVADIDLSGDSTVVTVSSAQHAIRNNVEPAATKVSKCFSLLCFATPANVQPRIVIVENRASST